MCRKIIFLVSLFFIFSANCFAKNDIKAIKSVATDKAIEMMPTIENPKLVYAFMQQNWSVVRQSPYWCCCVVGMYYLDNDINSIFNNSLQKERSNIEQYQLVHKKAAAIVDSLPMWFPRCFITRIIALVDSNRVVGKKYGLQMNLLIDDLEKDELFFAKDTFFTKVLTTKNDFMDELAIKKPLEVLALFHHKILQDSLKKFNDDWMANFEKEDAVVLMFAFDTTTIKPMRKVVNVSLEKYLNILPLCEISMRLLPAGIEKNKMLEDIFFPLFLSYKNTNLEKQLLQAVKTIKEANYYLAFYYLVQNKIALSNKYFEIVCADEDAEQQEEACTILKR